MSPRSKNPQLPAETPNPFRPTFGASPRFWAGRKAILEGFSEALDSPVGHPDRAMLISGTRGIGKTVLLTELEDIAEARGWISVRGIGGTGMAEHLINTAIPSHIAKLNPQAETRLKTLGIAGLGRVETELDPRYGQLQPVPTVETRIRQLLDYTSGSGVFIAIDEVQDAPSEDLAAAAQAFQNLIKDELPVALAFAGLTVGTRDLLDLPGTTFLRRASAYELGPLTADDTMSLLASTADGSGIHFGNAAARRAAEASYGFPYLVQLIGALAWRVTKDNANSEVTEAVIEEILKEAIDTFGSQVHRPALRHVTDLQREFLRSMARLGREEQSIGEIAGLLKKTTTGISRIRAALIKQELIEPSSHGHVRFTQPYMAEHLLAEPRTRYIQ
ncbi:MAG: AAA family ATPase [Corynebacterium casei]|uniref:ATP-binding protein n=3 Tax=Corynebacterium casei TaxID=160386 RepID=UPI0009C80EA5|nr:ATP-binding protein [Corynebacterium casei]MDN5923175.1 ATP-binding protein [Corynebacterium casei]MDN6263092.1 ATP-binding protein [Corynebacterium casei]MDN6272728.1 ATP-binding protein [Corynebacterium casei]MDN6286116.1 ATP-binding protein [Corynebacterium casei]MDN6313477.1 ATP-binding protein [Corynebacterium casei]